MTETSSAHTDHCFCTSNTAGQRACCQCPALYETPHVTGPLPEVAMSAREAALRAALEKIASMRYEESGPAHWHIDVMRIVRAALLAAPALPDSLVRARLADGSIRLGLDTSCAPQPKEQPIKFTKDAVSGDMVCEHGTAMDVHCCNCHSGFIFDKDHECPAEPKEQS